MNEGERGEETEDCRESREASALTGWSSKDGAATRKDATRRKKSDAEWRARERGDVRCGGGGGGEETTEARVVALLVMATAVRVGGD